MHRVILGSEIHQEVIFTMELLIIVLSLALTLAVPALLIAIIVMLRRIQKRLDQGNQEVEPTTQPQSRQ